MNLLIGDFQEITLSAVHRLKNDAYGMNIRNYLEEKEEREIHMAQVYAALSRLESLGLLASHKDFARSAGRRGRTRRIYNLTAHGLQYLTDSVRHSQGVQQKEMLGASQREKASTA
ncbi:PadR family transcriptional regulator [Palleronia sp.]|uniref:PadR family transcriptional regulator n=1 Tax=Palleronia sp. TaxID=1940284 RepID=UPI0035C7BCE5